MVKKLFLRNLFVPSFKCYPFKFYLFVLCFWRKKEGRGAWLLVAAAPATTGTGDARREALVSIELKMDAYWIWGCYCEIFCVDRVMVYSVLPWISK